MRTVDAGVIADRLGLPEEAVRDLQRRGFLRRLDLDDDQIRERLWRAHCAAGRARFSAAWSTQRQHSNA